MTTARGAGRRASASYPGETDPDAWRAVIRFAARVVPKPIDAAADGRGRRDRCGPLVRAMRLLLMPESRSRSRVALGQATRVGRRVAAASLLAASRRFATASGGSAATPPAYGCLGGLLA